MADFRRMDFEARLRAVLSASVTASRSFCAGWFLVEPEGLRMFFVRVAWRRANLGLDWRICSSIGGSMVLVWSGVGVYEIEGFGVDPRQKQFYQNSCFDQFASMLYKNTKNHSKNLPDRKSVV